jgi:FtsH-binding integral membrane protein
VTEREIFGFVELLGHSIAPNVAWVGCAVSTIGILFTMQNSEGAKQMLFIGGTTLGIASLIIIFLTATGVKYMSAVIPVLYRAIPLLVLDLYLFFK